MNDKPRLDHGDNDESLWKILESLHNYFFNEQPIEIKLVVTEKQHWGDRVREFKVGSKDYKQTIDSHKDT